MKTIRWQMVMEGSGDPAKIAGPEDVARFGREFLGLHGKDREHFIVLLLNAKNEVTAYETVTIGILNASLVHPREVFKPAIVGSAAAIIVIHNHPGGDPKPSLEDIEITERLRKSGELLGIPLRDHIIIGTEKFYSFKIGGTVE
jgi:DNA repair protein RadC